MNERRQTSLGIAAILVATSAICSSSAVALDCDVKSMRVTTRTMGYVDAELDDDDQAISFAFGEDGSTFDTFWLDNDDIADFERGKIDEFEFEWATVIDSPSYPEDFEWIRIKNNLAGDELGLGSLRVDIKCWPSDTYWKTIYTNRGINEELGYADYHHTEVDLAGTDDYEGDHEVFWLMNINDHDTDPVDGEPNGLNCYDPFAEDVECRVRAQILDTASNTLLEQQLTESYWDVNLPDDGEIHPFEENYSESDADNFWRWFWTSDSFVHDEVDDVRLVLDNCTYNEDCSLQIGYLHSTVMQSWGKPSYSSPYFRSHIYEGGYSTNTGWLEVENDGTDEDYVSTYYSRYYGFGNSHWHVEQSQDSEHVQEQQQPACGYMSADMILSTRGFPYEDVPYSDLSGCDTWEEASAWAHVEWGFKTMCCGYWDCCADIDDCTSDLPGSPKCTEANHDDWWDYTRCTLNYHNFDTEHELCNWKLFFVDSNTNGSYDTGEPDDESLVDYDGAYQAPIDWTEVTGANGSILGHFLTERDDTGNSVFSEHSSSTCGIDPVNDDEWFGDTKSVTDSLNLGYGVLFGWNHSVGECPTGSAGHWSVVDGYERIVTYIAPRTGIITWDYLFFIGDPNAPVGPFGTVFEADGIDNVGFTKEDFEDTIKGLTIWNYDYYR